MDTMKRPSTYWIGTKKKKLISVIIGSIFLRLYGKSFSTINPATANKGR